MRAVRFLKLERHGHFISDRRAPEIPPRPALTPLGWSGPYEMATALAVIDRRGARQDARPRSGGGRRLGAAGGERAQRARQGGAIADTVRTAH